uniref:WDR19 first beta-propeller domain-containing protein n=1 Tax=Haptolina ericina TaxID=156174 RepID=A0A7S3AT26_9EUKA|mmetsp:Transcript_3090/g.6632  ORF Transcript_3090/g.6632 Transcript_3090/m.6632 type:complete len:669 (+) Transcript_3090:67-2073(+)
MSSSVEEQVGEITARDSVNEAISKAAMFGIPAQRPAETSADAVAAAGLTNEAAAPAAALPADGVAGDVDLESASSSDPALEVSSATSAEETITAVDEPAATEASAPAAVEAAAPAISEPSDQPSSTAPVKAASSPAVDQAAGDERLLGDYSAPAAEEASGPAEGVGTGSGPAKMNGSEADSPLAASIASGAMIALPKKTEMTFGANREKGKLALDLDKMAQGDHSLEPGDFITTARARNEVAITVRGAAKARAKLLMKLTPKDCGNSNLKAAWQPCGGKRLAVASEQDGNCVLAMYARKGERLRVHNLGPGRPSWCDWDCSGNTVAIMQEGTGLYLWDVGTADVKPISPPKASKGKVTPGRGGVEKEQPGVAELITQPLRLCPSITVATSFCMWSRVHPQLAIGTHGGKVIVFNKKEGVMQLHDRKGKHGAPVTCGDWLFDNRLGLASGTRVKISKPVPEKGAQWESYSKFKLSGMLSRVPRKFKDAGAPKLLSFSLKYPPFVAVCIGDNYMLVFGTSGQHVNEDVGLTFPDDYGPITGFQWLEDDVVLVALANGYVTSVDFGAMVRMRQQHGLPECVKATGTTKVFNEYLKCLTYSTASQKIACVGDRGFKVITRVKDELEVLADISLDYELTLGNCLEVIRWDQEGKAVTITATNGYLWSYEIANK